MTRGRETARLAFDWGLTGDTYIHNLRELGLDPAGLDAPRPVTTATRTTGAGWPAFSATSRRAMRRGLPFYGGSDHFFPRYNERNGERVYIGRLDRDELERQDLDVRVVARAHRARGGRACCSGEMHETVPGETIPASLKVERDGEMVPDTFIGEQTLIVARARARAGGGHLLLPPRHRGHLPPRRARERGAEDPRGGRGLPPERARRGAHRARGRTSSGALGVDWLVPQHCTGMEAFIAIGNRLPAEMVVSSVGSTFTFEA